MGFFLIIVGVIMLVAGVRDTQCALIQTVKGDFSGDGNFFYWLAVILIIGALGYSETLKPVATGLLALIILALFLTRGKQSLFQNLTDAIGQSKGTGVTGSNSVNQFISGFFGAGGTGGSGPLVTPVA